MPNEKEVCPVCHGEDTNHCENCFEIEVKDYCTYDHSDEISGNENVNHPQLNEHREETNREHTY